MASKAIVHIVDDESAVREALATLLRASGIDTQCHGSAEEFLQNFDPLVPGCVVIDICMPGMNGLTLQTRLSTGGQRIPVVILTGHADVPMAVEAMRRGAAGFLQKPPRGHELLEIVTKAVEWHTDYLVQQATFENASRRFETLTDRERDVLSHVVEGKSSKEIAGALGIGQRTVEQHRSHLLRKLNVNSLAELIQISLRRRSSAESGKPSCVFLDRNRMPRYPER